MDDAAIRKGKCIDFLIIICSFHPMSIAPLPFPNRRLSRQWASPRDSGLSGLSRNMISLLPSADFRDFLENNREQACTLGFHLKVEVYPERPQGRRRAQGKRGKGIYGDLHAPATSRATLASARRSEWNFTVTFGRFPVFFRPGLWRHCPKAQALLLHPESCCKTRHGC